MTDAVAAARRSWRLPVVLECEPESVTTGADVAHFLISPTLVDVGALARSGDLATLRALVLAQRPELAAFPADRRPGDWYRPLDGGYSLIADGAVLVGPQCCGDLTDLRSWRDLAEYDDAEWQEFWIGHPVLLGRYVAADETLEISPGFEPGTEPCVPVAGAPVHRVPAATLALLVEAAEQDIAAAALRLNEALADLLPLRTRRWVVDALLGRPVGAE